MPRLPLPASARKIKLAIARWSANPLAMVWPEMDAARTAP